jgi:hypothetical protein
MRSVPRFQMEVCILYRTATGTLSLYPFNLRLRNLALLARGCNRNPARSAQQDVRLSRTLSRTVEQLPFSVRPAVFKSREAGVVDFT